MQTRSLPAGRDRDETLGVPWPPPPPPHPTGPPLTIPAAQRCRGPTLEGGEEMAAERLRNVVRFEVTPQEQREPLKIDALVGGGAESGWGGAACSRPPQQQCRSQEHTGGVPGPHLSLAVPRQGPAAIKILQHVLHLPAAVWRAETPTKPLQRMHTRAPTPHTRMYPPRTHMCAHLGHTRAQPGHACKWANAHWHNVRGRPPTPACESRRRARGCRGTQTCEAPPGVRGCVKPPHHPRTPTDPQYLQSRYFCSWANSWGLRVAQSRFSSMAACGERS